MILLLPMNVLQLWLLTSVTTTSTTAAYTSTPPIYPHHLFGTFRSHNSRLHPASKVSITGAKSESAAATAAWYVSSTRLCASSIDPNDPYAKVLEAYQKKSKGGAGSDDDNFSTSSLPAPDIPSDYANTDSSGTTTTTSSMMTPLDSYPSNAPSDPIVTTTDPVQDIVQAIQNAASTAVEASNQASEAAASVSASLSPTASIEPTDMAPAADATSAALENIRAATTAATTPVGAVEGKAPTLLEYLTSLGSSSSSEKRASAEISPDVKEKLIILKNNLLSQGSVATDSAEKSLSMDASSSLGTTVKAITAGAGAAASGSVDLDALGLNLDSIDWSKLVENFQLEQYGAWYVTAFTVLYALNQKEVGKAEAQKLFEEELMQAKVKAQEAANAAVIAAEGAKQAKEMVKNIPLEKVQNVGEIMLENSKIRNLEVENEIMKAELSKLQSENMSQMTLITNLVKQKNESQLVTEVAVTNKEPHIPVVKVTMERDPEEDKKILKILKDMDEENARQKESQKTTITPAAATTSTTTTPVKKERKKGRAPKKSEVTAKVKKEESPSTEPVSESAPVSVPRKAAASNKAKGTKSNRKAAKKGKDEEVVSEKEAIAVGEEVMDDEPVEDALKVIEAAEESFNEAMEESNRESAVIEELKNMIAKSDQGVEEGLEGGKSSETLSPTTAKSSNRKKKESKPSVKNEMTNPWGSLKESTLKRKTIAELTEYLNEREINAEGLSKTELVGTIQKL